MITEVTVISMHTVLSYFEFIKTSCPEIICHTSHRHGGCRLTRSFEHVLVYLMTHVGSRVNCLLAVIPSRYPPMLSIQFSSIIYF